MHVRALTTINSYTKNFLINQHSKLHILENIIDCTSKVIFSEKLFYSSGVTESHITWILSFNPPTVRCGSFRSFLFMMAQRFSMGSGLDEGQSNTSIPFSCSHFFVVFAVWEDAPSCWNIYSPQSASFGTDGRRFSCNILIYLSAFTIPSMK